MGVYIRLLTAYWLDRAPMHCQSGLLLGQMPFGYLVQVALSESVMRSGYSSSHWCMSYSAGLLRSSIKDL